MSPALRVVARLAANPEQLCAWSACGAGVLDSGARRRATGFGDNFGRIDLESEIKGQNPDE